MPDDTPRNEQDTIRFLERQVAGCIASQANHARQLDESSRKHAEEQKWLAQHEKWINERSSTLDSVDDRFSMLDGASDRHENFINAYNGRKADRDKAWLVMETRVDEVHRFMLEYRAAELAGADTKKSNTASLANIIQICLLLVAIGMMMLSYFKGK